MKKLLCGVMLSAAGAGALLGYYDVNSNSNMVKGSTRSMAANQKMTVRSKSIIESDIKNTEKRMHDLDRQISLERNTMAKQQLQKERAMKEKHLNNLEAELRKASK